MPDPLERELAAAVEWLREQLKSVRYGEVAVRLIVHGGEVTRTERSVVEKLSPVAGSADARGT